MSLDETISIFSYDIIQIKRKNLPNVRLELLETLAKLKQSLKICYLSCVDFQGTDSTDFILHAAQNCNIFSYSAEMALGTTLNRMHLKTSEKSAFVLHPC